MCFRYACGLTVFMHPSLILFCFGLALVRLGRFFPPILVCYVFSFQSLFSLLYISLVLLVTFIPPWKRRFFFPPKIS